MNIKMFWCQEDDVPLSRMQSLNYVFVNYSKHVGFLHLLDRFTFDPKNRYYFFALTLLSFSSSYKVLSFNILYSTFQNFGIFVTKKP